MMDIVDVRDQMIEDNVEEADKVRDFLNRRGIYLINVMASPGAGKTTTILQLISRMKDRFHIGVLEADVDSKVDADKVALSGVKVLQLHTGGSCHMNAQMTLEGLQHMDLDGVNLMFLENVGNLVCPAEFDTGAQTKLMILSVPEGDDKPLKYPLMFKVSDIMLVNKIDTTPVFDFNLDRCQNYVQQLNPAMPVYPVSAIDGTGFDPVVRNLVQRIDEWRKSLV